MPYKNGRITTLERQVARLAVEPPTAEAVAHKLGRDSGQIRSVLGRPAVLTEIARIQEERLVRDLLPIALDVLRDIASDARAPAGARVQAAKVIVDRSFTQAGIDGGKAGDDQSQMTPEQIGRAIAELERARADLLRPVIEAQAQVVEPPKVDLFE